MTLGGRPNRFQVGIAEPEVGRLGPSTTTREAEGTRRRDGGESSHRLKSGSLESSVTSGGSHSTPSTRKRELNDISFPHNIKKHISGC